MMTELRKGRIFAIIQFGLILIIVISAYLENKFFQHNPVPIVRTISIILFVCGLLVLMLALLSFRQRITPNPVPLEHAQLRTGGIYSVIRHPMYAFALLFAVGYTLIFPAYYSLLINIIVIIFLVYKIRFEEKQLIQKFPQYTEYQKHTNKLIPYLY
jgi:protein-S-isoprenylcysteine O-methyltransferase Ste14